MKTLTKTLLFVLLLASPVVAWSQDADRDREELQMAAVEALITAPPERALPLATKVLKGNYSDDIKESALFVLSQIDRREAQDLILETARSGDGDLRFEAIRMIGISGKGDALTQLTSLYDADDEDVREAVLEAFLIAGDKESVYQLAVNAATEDEFEDAVDTLGAMGARAQLQRLREARGVSEAYIDALIISGDAETLLEIAQDGSNEDNQVQAIEALGIVGGHDEKLVDIYRNAGSDDIREAALDGMLISGYDDGVLELYRSSTDAAEKKELLEQLVIMDSDEVWSIIDSALDGGL